jgi:hypothetical protein
MAEDTLDRTEGQNTESGGTDNVSTLDALHLDGKGQEGLEDGQEQELTNTDEAEGEDVKAFANVQSAGRETFEKMQAGAPAEEGAVPVGDRVVPEAYTPSEPDNNVEAQFTNPFPAFPQEAAPEVADSPRPAEAPAPQEEVRPPEPRPVAEPEVGEEDPQPAAEDSPAPIPVAVLPLIVEDVIPRDDGEAQPANLQLKPVSGTEDIPTKLDIVVSTGDTDGSGDQLASLDISGLPDDFVIVDRDGNAIGERIGDLWRLPNPTPDSLDNIYLKNLDSDDDADFSGDFTLKVTATTTDPTSTATVSDFLTVHIEAVADTPEVAVADTFHMENQWQDLTIAVTNKDQDNSEVQLVYVSDLPDGAVLNQGTLLAADTVVDGVTIPAGSYELTIAQLTGLKILPPTNDSHDFTLSVRAVSTEGSNGDQAISNPLTIQVDVGVVAPSVAGSGSGLEDQWANVDLTASVNLPDGTETLTVFVKDLPAGSELAYRNGTVLTPDGDGVYEVTGHLNDLMVRWATPQHTDADITLTVVGRVADGDTDTDSATVQAGAPDVNSSQATVTVRIDAVADTPVITVHDTAHMENQWQDLSITVASPDADGSEFQSVYVMDLPDGAQLNQGTVLTADKVVDGVTIPAGSYELTSAQLTGLKILPPTNDSHDFTLTVRGVSTEHSNGDQAISAPLTIEVDVGVVAPSASGSGVGNEDDWALLDLNAAVNLPDGTETLSVMLTDLPADAQLAYQGSGTVLVPDGNGHYSIALTDLDNLKVRWTNPQHTDADISFNLTATVRDGDTDSDSAAVQAGAPDINAVTVPVTAVIRAVADAPTLSAAAIGVEDQWHPLTINTALVDADGSESLSVTVTGPAGFTLNAGVESAPGSGTWTLTPAQLTGLQFKPPQDSDTDFNLSITSTTTEAATGDQVAVKTAATTSTITVKVLSDADAPTVLVDEPAKHVAEDGFYNLRTVLQDGGYAVTGALGELGGGDGMTASPDGSEALTFQIDPVENTGLRLQTLNSGTGTWSDVPLSGGAWTVSSADVFAGHVRVGGPADWASSNAADAIHFDIRTIAAEANDSTDDALQAANPTLVRDGQATSAWDRLTLVIDPVADTATLIDSNAGNEDQVGGITIDPTATFTDTDFSERPDPNGTVTIVTSDPDMTSGHFELTVGGITTTITPTVGGDGAYTWAIPGSAFEQSPSNPNQWTLTGLKFFPTTHLAEDATYTVNVPAYDTQTSVTRTLTATGSVTVNAVADIPDLAAGHTYGMENTAIAVDVSASLVDLADGSETLAVYLADFPAGSTFNHGIITTQAVTVDGVTIPAGALKLDPADLDTLTVQPPANYSDDMTFRVWATTAEDRNGDMAINGPVTAMVDIGIVDPSAAGSGSGLEDQWASLNLSASVNAADGNESLRVFIEDLPAGAQIGKISGSGSFSQVTYTDSNGVSHTGYEVTGNLDNVKVRWSGTHLDTDMTLNLRAIATDRDADAAADSGGIDRATAITDLISPDTSDVVVPVNVVFKAVADAPTLTASGIGVEDKWVSLNISTALVDTDGTETLAVYVTDLPAGATLSAGTFLAAGETLADGTTTIAAGSWKLTPAQLSGLKINNLPLDADTDFPVTVKSVTTEAATGVQVGTKVAVTSSTFNVTVFGDADKPTVRVDPDTQTVNEDTFFDLRTVLAGYDPVTGASGESGSALATSPGTALSADGSESITTFRITPQETGTRLAISADGTIDAAELQALPASGYWEVSAADVFAGKIKVGGKAGWSSASDADTIHFGVQTIVRESDYAANTSGLTGTGLTRETTNISDPQILALKITPVADAPSLTASGIGVEDKWAALTISTAAVDPDGSESIAAVYLSGLPAGAGLSAGTYLAEGETLSNGTVIPAGSWRLTTAELSGLKVTNLPTDSDSDFPLTVRSVSIENSTIGQPNPAIAVTSTNFTVTVFGDADKPTVRVDADTQIINEDTMFQLRSVLPGYDPVSGTLGEAGSALAGSLATAISADGSESLTLFRIYPTETGTRLAVSADTTIATGEYVTLPASGYWEVSAADVFAGKIYVGGKANWSSAVDGDTIHFNIRTVAREGDYAANTAALSGTGLTRATENVSDPMPLTLKVIPVADTPNLTASGVGVEDKWVALNITTSLTDTDGSESIAALYISGMPAGTSLSAGTLLTADETLANGTTVIPAGTWKLTTGQLTGLKITGLATDSDSDFSITVKSVSVENAADTPLAGKVAVKTVTATVTVFGDADKPTVRVDADTQTISEDAFFELRSVLSGYDPVSGASGEAGSALATSTATALSADGSETITTFRITPVEAGTRLAISSDATITGDELQSLPASGYWEVSAADVFAGKIYVGGKANWSSANDGDTIHFNVQTVVREGDYAANTAALSGTGLTRATTTVSDPQLLTLKINSVADATTVGVAAIGDEDTLIAVNPTFTLNDQDGSEHLANTVDILIPKGTAHGQLTDASGEPFSFTDDGTNLVYSFPVSSLTTTRTVSGVAVEFRLDGVYFDNVQHSDTDLTYKIRVTSEDTGGTQNTYTTPDQTLVVKAVADAPAIAVGNAVNGVVTGTEDTRIDLDLSAALVDADGSETLSKAELWSVDDGWEVGYVDGSGHYTAAQDLGTGKWNIDTTRLDQVVLTAPHDTHHLSAANVQMEFHAWTLEAATGGQLSVAEATSQTTFQVVVNADADTPTLQLTHARVDEDHRVKLDIRSALTDTDGSESLSVFISNLPDGGTLQNAAGGQAGILVSFDGNNQPVADANGTTWMLSPAQLNDVYFTPKHDSNVDGNITVTARSTEGSNLDFAENTATLRVIVRGISDGPEIPAEHLLVDGSGSPVLDGNGRQILTATGIEDKVTDAHGAATGGASGALIDPGFGNYGTLDIDVSETLSIVLKNIPANVAVEMANGGESYLKYIGGDKWSVDPAHLGDVRFRAEPNFAGTFDVKLDLITTEDDGDSLGQERTLRVFVDADADTPSGSIGASVNEDSWLSGATDNGITINVSASAADLTGGVEHISALTIDLDTSLLGGIDANTVSLTFGGQTYVPVNGHITIVMNEAPGAGQLNLASCFTDTTNNGLTFDSGSVGGLKLFGVPADWSNDIPIKLTVTATDVDNSTATRVINGKVAIAPDVDTPTFSVDDSTISAVPGEIVDLAADSGANLTFGLNDIDLSEAASYFIVTGVPQGMSLSYGINAGEGTWVLPANAGTFPPTVTTAYTGTATLNFYAVVKDTDAEGHTDVANFGPVAVTLTVAADGTHPGSGPWPTTPPVTIGAPDITGTLATPEDTAFNLGGLTITADNPATETISGLVLTDVPTGASVSGGYYNFLSGDWVVPAGSSSSLAVTPPDDFSGTMSIGVRAVATMNGLYAVTEAANLPVAVSPVTDGGSFSLSAHGGAANIEDAGDIPLSIALGERDSDFSESLVDGVLTIRMTGGAGQLIGADGQPLVPVSANTYQVNIADFAVNGQTSLTGLSFRPPAQYSGTISLQFSTSVSDQGATAATASGTLSFSIQADADTPTVHAQNVTGNEDTAIALDIMMDGKDLVGANAYGSEGISVIIGNVPAGAIIQGAFNNNDGTWTVKGANVAVVNDPVHGWVAKLVNVSVLPSQDDSSDWTLSVTAYTNENGVKNEIASASGTFSVTVNGVADLPTIDPQAASGSEDVELALNLNAQLIDLSESLSVTISGVPAGAIFTDGQGHQVGTELSTGVWKIAQADIGTLHFKGSLHASGSWTMSAVATSVDDSSTANSNIKTFSVTLAGIADQPTLSVTDLTPAAAGNQASGNEDSNIALSFSAGLVDTDGSETLSVTITGAPTGTKFIALDGTQVVESSGGQWVIDAADIAGLRMVPPADWYGDAVLTLTATSTEGVTTASSSAELTVHVDAINDAPDVSLFTVSQGISGTAVNTPIHVLPGPDTIQVADVDGTALTGMTIKIAGGWEMGDSLGVSDINLGFNTQGGLVVGDTGIAVSYDQANHALIFTGNGTYAEYGAIAAKVVLTNDTGAIDPGTRQFDVTVFDESGATDTVQTNASIGAIGATDPITLTGDALGDIRWSSNGATINGDTLFVSPDDNGITATGSSGLDVLTLQHNDGSAGDWLLQVDQNDPTTITGTSDTDKDFVVHLDPNSGTAAIDANGDLVFNGDASGRIEFEDHSTVYFNSIDKMAV